MTIGRTTTRKTYIGNTACFVSTKLHMSSNGLGARDTRDSLVSLRQWVLNKNVHQNYIRVVVH